jgi:hypothetical protein
MGISANVVEHLLRSGERAFHVNHPLGSFRSGQMPSKRATLTKRFQCSEELQFAGIECFLQGFQKEAPE